MKTLDAGEKKPNTTSRWIKVCSGRSWGTQRNKTIGERKGSCAAFSYSLTLCAALFVRRRQIIWIENNECNRESKE